jgi:hypothetical protein
VKSKEASNLWNIFEKRSSRWSLNFYLNKNQISRRIIKKNIKANLDMNFLYHLKMLFPCRSLQNSITLKVFKSRLSSAAKCASVKIG